MESRDLGTYETVNLKLVRRSFDSLCSLRMTNVVELRKKFGWTGVDTWLAGL